MQVASGAESRASSAGDLLSGFYLVSHVDKNSVRVHVDVPGGDTSAVINFDTPAPARVLDDLADGAFLCGPDGSITATGLEISAEVEWVGRSTRGLNDRTGTK